MARRRKLRLERKEFINGLRLRQDCFAKSVLTTRQLAFSWIADRSDRHPFPAGDPCSCIV